MLRLRTGFLLSVFGLALSAATASAALPELSPASGTFKGESKATVKFVAKTKGTIECSSTTTEGVVTAAKEGALTVDFAGCKLLGVIEAGTLGDSKGHILQHGAWLMCYINKAAKEVGFEDHFEIAHLEFVGKLWTLVGWFIGKWFPVLVKGVEFSATFKEKGSETGVQEIKKCEGSREETLLISEGTGAFEQAAFVGVLPIDFSASHEILA